MDLVILSFSIMGAFYVGYIIGYNQRHRDDLEDGLEE